VIRAHLPGLPPSVNHCYFQKGKLRTLTSAGRKYKVEAKSYLAQNHQGFLSFFKKNKPYAVVLRLNVNRSSMLWGGWPKTAENRYKAFDVTNYTKIVEDAIVDACGHDDRQHFYVSVFKQAIPDQSEESVDIWAFDLDSEEGPLSEYFDNA